MLAHRIFSAAGILIGVVAVYYLLPETIDLLRVSSMRSAGVANDLTIEHLKIRLEGRSGYQAPVFKVTVENSHPRRNVTLLRWDTPLDKSSFRTGVLTIIDTTSGESVQSPGMKINRKLPPAHEDLVEIPVEGAFEEELALNEP